MLINRFSGLMSSPPAEGDCGPAAAAERDAGTPPLQPRRCTPSLPAAQAPPCRCLPPPPALPAVSAFREGARSQGERNLDADLIAFFEGFNHLKSRNVAECRGLNNHARPVKGNAHLHGVTAVAGDRKECDPDVKDIYIDVDRTRPATLPAPDPVANPGQGGHEGTGAYGGGGAGGAPGGGAGGNNLEAEFCYNVLLTCRCLECQRMIAGWGCQCHERLLCTECRIELQGRPGILCPNCNTEVRPGILCPSCNTEVQDAIEFELDLPAGMMTVTTHPETAPEDPAEAQSGLPGGHHHPGPPWEYAVYVAVPGGPDFVALHEFLYNNTDEGGSLAYVYRQ